MSLRVKRHSAIYEEEKWTSTHSKLLVDVIPDRRGVQLRIDVDRDVHNYYIIYSYMLVFALFSHDNHYIQVTDLLLRRHHYKLLKMLVSVDACKQESWQTVRTRMTCCIMWYFIGIRTVRRFKRIYTKEIHHN